MLTETLAGELVRQAPSGVAGLTVHVEKDPLASRFFILWIEDGLPRLDWVDYDATIQAWDANMFEVFVSEFWGRTERRSS